MADIVKKTWLNYGVSCGFGHIYWRDLNGKLHFFCSEFNSGCRSSYIFTSKDNILGRSENEREKRQQQQK